MNLADVRRSRAGPIRMVLNQIPSACLGNHGPGAEFPAHGGLRRVFILAIRRVRRVSRRHSKCSCVGVMAAERWRRFFFACGIGASVLFVAMTLFVGLFWEGYSVVSRVPSELSAIGAPTRRLWIGLGIVYA